jgi:hypothetical protein
MPCCPRTSLRMQRSRSAYCTRQACRTEPTSSAGDARGCCGREDQLGPSGYALIAGNSTLVTYPHLGHSYATSPGFSPSGAIVTTSSIGAVAHRGHRAWSSRVVHCRCGISRPLIWALSISPQTYNTRQWSWFRGTAQRTAAASLTARLAASLRMRGLGAARVADRAEAHAERDCSNDEHRDDRRHNEAASAPSVAAGTARPIRHS